MSIRDIRYFSCFTHSVDGKAHTVPGTTTPCLRISYRWPQRQKFQSVLVPCKSTESAAALAASLEGHTLKVDYTGAEPIGNGESTDSYVVLIQRISKQPLRRTQLDESVLA